MDFKQAIENQLKELWLLSRWYRSQKQVELANQVLSEYRELRKSYKRINELGV